MRNWRTTLAGLAAAVMTVNANGVSWKSLLAAAFTALVGALAKDFNISQ